MKLTSRQFTQNLTAFAESLRAQIESEVDGFPTDPKAQQARTQRAHKDFEFFCRTYFPHYIEHSNSLLHDYLYRALPKLIDTQREETQAVAAPRGEAKSTIANQLLSLWSVITGRRHYIVIIMDSYDQAAIMLEMIKAELEANPRLEMDYPKIVGIGKVWKEGTIITRNKIKVEVFGSGKRIRGRRHGPHRPDLVICDDLENDENVQSPAQRDKLQRWFSRSVLKLGAAGGSCVYLIIGTILHYDSLLSRTLKNPLWRSKRFQAILKWPERMDLWDEFERLIPKSKTAARKYYAANRTEMDAGAEVSWPQARPLVELMTIRARDGHEAFDSELQNDPVSGEGAPFATILQYWSKPDPNWIYLGACDPSLGKAGASRDPCAILIGGLNRKRGELAVVEAVIAKLQPDQIIEQIIAFQSVYSCIRWAVESVQFQEFLRQELVTRSAQRGCPVPAMPIIPHTDKTLRIQSLQPHVKNGLIKLGQDQSTLIEQLKHWPKADHDDGPDCLHMLWSIAASHITGSQLTDILTRRRSMFAGEPTWRDY